MSLIAPRSPERDNQNALRKFPFADAAVCGNGTCTIPAGAIIDAQLYVPGRTPGRVWLESVGTDGRLRFADDDGVFAETAVPPTAEAAVPVIFTGDGGPLPGGVIAFGAKAEVAALNALGGQSFSADQAELASAAVAWLGLPGVCGFKLDDGHVVSGNVTFRGANGCDVSAFTSGGVNYLRISAIGQTAETIAATGFITGIDATSDNAHFVVSNNALSDHVIDLRVTGAATLQDDGLNADQETACAVVRKARGTVPSEAGTAPVSGEDCVCTEVATHTITFADAPAGSNQLTLVDGSRLFSLADQYLPEVTPTGMRFAGYYDKAYPSPVGVTKRLYYRYDGSGVGFFSAGANVTLYAHWISASSEASVDFEDYGTLHLAAPDDLTYSNPLDISGCTSPIPAVRTISEDALAEGGAEALADLIRSPEVPSGEVRLSLRGLNKAYSS